MTADVQLHFQMVPDVFREEPMKRTRYRSNSGSGSRGTVAPYLHHNLPHHLPQHLHEAIIPSRRVEEDEEVEDGEEEEEEPGRVAGKGSGIRRGMVEEEISPRPRTKRAKRSRYNHQHQRPVTDGMMLVGIGGDNEGNRGAMGSVAGISGGEMGRGFKRKSEGSYLDAHEGGEVGSGVSCPPTRRFHDMSTTAHSGGRGGVEEEGEWGTEAPELTPREVKRWKRENLKREIGRCVSLQARLDDLIRRKQPGARDLGGGGVRHHQRQLHALAPPTSGYGNGSSNGLGAGRAMAGAGVFSLQQQQQQQHHGRLAAAAAPLTSTEPFPSFTTTTRSGDIRKERMKETCGSRSDQAEDMTVAVPAVMTKEPRLSSRQASLAVGDNVVAVGSVPAGGSIPALPAATKRTPKPNLVYNNAEFVIGKDRAPAADKPRVKPLAAPRRTGTVTQAKPLSVYEAKKQKIETVRAKRMADIMKQCAAVLRKIQNQKNSWVFNEPVNWDQLKLYDYPKIIKKPMDLGTVRRKLESGEYGHPDPFAEDVRLVFSNAMTYNQPNSEVHDLAKDLLGMFEERYKNIEDKLAEEAIKFRVEEDALAALAGEARPPPEVRGPTAKVVNQPKTGPKVPQQQQSVERRVPLRQSGGGKAKPPPQPPAAAAAAAPPTAPPPSLPPPSPPQQHSAMAPVAARKRPMTMEEKRKLSQNLGQLPGEKLGHIVHILSLRNPSLNQGEDEIELDIDSLDTETLWDLHSFVSSCMKSSRRNAARIGGGRYDHHESDEHDAWIHSSGDHHQPQDEEDNDEEDENEEKKAVWAKNHQSSSSTRPTLRKQELIGEEESRKGDSASIVQKSPKDDAKREAPDGVEEDVDIDDGAPTAIFSPVVIEKDDGGYGSKSSSSSSSSGESESSSSDSESGSSSGSDSEPEEPVQPPGAGSDAGLKISGAEPTGSSGGTDCRGPIGGSSSSPALKKNSVKNETHAPGSGERLNDEEDTQKHKMSLPSTVTSREPAQVDERPLDCSLDELPGTTLAEMRSPVEVAVAMQDVAVGDAPCSSDSPHTRKALSTSVEVLVDAKAPVPVDHTQGLVVVVEKMHVADVGVMHDSAEVQCSPQCNVVNQVPAAPELVGVDAMMLSSDDAATLSLSRMVEVGCGTLVQSSPLLETNAGEQGACDEPSGKPTAKDVSECVPPPMLSPALSPLALTPATMQRPLGPAVAVAEIADVAESSPPPPPPVTPIASGPASLIAAPATSGVPEGPSAEESGSAVDSVVKRPPPSTCVPEEKVVAKESEVDHLLGSEVAVRAAMLRGRFAETIIKAREKIAQPSLTNAKVEKIDPETVKRQQEETRRRQKEEMEQFKAAAKAVEAAKKRAEEEAAAQLKHKRELEREAARKALQTMEKTVEIDEQWSVMRAMQELTMDPGTGTAGAEGEIPSKVGTLGKLFNLAGGDCLEKLGLYRKQEESDDEEEIGKVNNDERVDMDCVGVEGRDETVGNKPRKDRGDGHEKAHRGAGEANGEGINGSRAQGEVVSGGDDIGDDEEGKAEEGKAGEGKVGEGKGGEGKGGEGKAGEGRGVEGGGGGEGKQGDGILRDVGSEVVLPDGKELQEGYKTAQGAVEQKVEVEDGEIG